MQKGTAYPFMVWIVSVIFAPSIYFLFFFFRDIVFLPGNEISDGLIYLAIIPPYWAAGALFSFPALILNLLIYKAYPKIEYAVSFLKVLTIVLGLISILLAQMLMDFNFNLGLVYCACVLMLGLFYPAKKV